MSNLDLLSAGFSAILGTEVVPQKTGGKYSIHDLFSQTYVMKPVETVEKVEAGKKFNVYVRGLSGNTITIQVTGDDTIEQVKAKIEETEGISTDEIKLIYTAKQLENHRTINDYGIQPDETIFMVICTTGGGSQWGVWKNRKPESGIGTGMGTGTGTGTGNGNGTGTVM